MIGHSIPEYIFIRISIFCLRLIAPLSIVYIALSLHAGELLYSRWIGIYAIAEAFFYLFVYLPRSWLLQKPATHPPLLSRKDREELFCKCFARIRETGLATGWFFSPPADGIKRENMVEWLLWALFGVHLDGLREEWVEELEGYIQMIEKLLGREMENGWDKEISCMKVSLDPVVMLHRPLIWYSIVAFIDTVTGLQLMWHGFKHFTASGWNFCFPPRLFTFFSRSSHHPDLVYWYRPHRSTTKHPILFLHGIGIGLWPYVPFLAELAAEDPDVGIIAMENLSMSMRMCSPPPTREALLDAITYVLDTHDFDHVVVAAHSYGTVTAAHMLRDPALSERVSAWLLVDPIPFLLHLPAVAYNFVYRPPRTANEWQLWYFASRDPDIARALARHFFWAQNILWKEDLVGRRVAVILSERDQIVDTLERGGHGGTVLP
ncbi:hypothetical protein A0H81_10886 [Grifola frondosa]|uniref:AB hydrolase-1 domain-containing protein n=1 Tax=Grifola frondosa TaxID=5627 RepID=A0A1C7LYH6_GRIFR|nr:hypothetical protein A0H81_10886 [Grifola frondosa]